MLKHIKEVQRKYHGRGFKVTDIHADSEFEKIRNVFIEVDEDGDSRLTKEELRKCLFLKSADNT